MNQANALEQLTGLCTEPLASDPRPRAALARAGITESFVFESFRLGYCADQVAEHLARDQELRIELERCGAIKNGRVVLQGCLTIPVLDETGTVVNVVGYKLSPRAKRPLVMIGEDGIFNAPFLSKQREVIFVESPLDALTLIQHDFPHTTFPFGSDAKYLKFAQDQGIRAVTFTFEGRARLFADLTRAGVSARRVPIELDGLPSSELRASLQRLLDRDGGEASISDAVTEIEGGFLFRFPQVTYRVIGSFAEHTTRMKANIKAQLDQSAFVDSIDLYRNRDRQNFTYQLMDRFGLSDQAQIESDLTQIIDVIEKHREKREDEKKRVKPALTDHQRQIGMELLKSSDLVDQIDRDYTELGYVRERKNKLLLYLVMTSRLMHNPLHAIIISRSSAGKSMLVEVTEQLCPPEDVESVSDLSAQALYYYGKDDLKHCFIVIGEKHGSEGSDYPLRELISRRSITKAVPMKDPVTGQVKTETITVNGPISLAETTTKGDVNPENLSRSFVVGIDESEDQTRLIHDRQRTNYTVDGFLQRRSLDRITERHHFAQRLLEPVLVFNPYAEVLTFPASTLKTRRDHEKFLRLINAICFLYQYQRRRKQLTLDGGET